MHHIPSTITEAIKKSSAQVTRRPRVGPKWHEQPMVSSGIISRALSVSFSLCLCFSFFPSVCLSLCLCHSPSLSLSVSVYHSLSFSVSLCVSVSLSVSLSYAQRYLCYVDVCTVLSHLSYHLGFLSDSICFQNCVQTAQKRGDIKHFNLL